MPYPIFPVGSSRAYRIENSIRIDQQANKYFTRTLGTPTNATTWTLSFWMRYGFVRTSTNTTLSYFGTSSTNGLSSNGTQTHNLVLTLGGTAVITGATATAQLADNNAWYHIVVTTTGGNNHAIYVNGRTYATSTTAYTGGTINTAVAHFLGAYNSSAGSQMDGYLADVCFIDGQVVAPTSFGTTDATSGQWIPIKYGGTFGNNGFYLTFSDGSASTAATLGKDSSPNGNNWTPNALVVSGTLVSQDWTQESPTPYEDRGAFMYWTTNTAFGASNASYPRQGGRFASNSENASTTYALTEGKWYWEVYCTAVTTGGGTGLKNVETGATFAYTTTFSAGQTVGFRYDTTVGSFEYTTNGTVWTAITTNGATASSGPWVPYQNFAGGGSIYINSGYFAFTYTKPTGYNPVCNVYFTSPTGILTKPMNYQNLTTYTGTGATRSVSNAITYGSVAYQFRPDIIFIAANATANNKPFYDSVRGATAQLLFNTSAAETTVATGVTSFNSDGFSVGSDTLVNASGTTFLAGQIAIGGSPVTNTDGTITSTVLANQTTGVSIVTWTGTGVAGTIGHGLNATPEAMIIKIRSTTGVGNMYHKGLNAGTTPWGYILDMSTTANEAADTAYLNNTAPTSSVFSVGVSAKTNTLGATYVAYCFASKTGFSRVSQYLTGSSTAQLSGAAWTGGKPRWAIVKQRNGTTLDGWYLVNFNANQNPITSVTRLASSSTAATVSLVATTFGFKINQATGVMNQNSNSYYVFIAFNETSFVWSNPK